jgi:hypothetical protein
MICHSSLVGLSSVAARQRAQKGEEEKKKKKKGRKKSRRSKEDGVEQPMWWSVSELQFCKSSKWFHCAMRKVCTMQHLRKAAAAALS